MARQVNEGSDERGIVDRMKNLLQRSDRSAPDDRPVHFSPKFRRVHVIINPAAGSDEPILNTLNTVFNDLSIDWDAFVTKKGGDAERMAREAVAAGVDAVACYGGDGTVLEVASGLIDSPVPLCILPGGTGNVLSIELGIPNTLAEAAALLGEESTEVRALDMGRANGHLFFHLGLGLEGEMIKGADREKKDSAGLFAYIRSALSTLQDATPSHYRITVDDQQYETEGVNLMITNFGSIGVAGLKLAHNIDMSDGLLDVLVLRRADIGTLLSAAANAIKVGS